MIAYRVQSYRLDLYLIFRECLHEISPEQLQRVLNMLENVSDTQMKVSNR